MAENTITKIDILSNEAIDHIDNCRHKMLVIDKMFELYAAEDPEADICTWEGLKLMVADWLEDTQEARDCMEKIGLTTFKMAPGKSEIHAA